MKLCVVQEGSPQTECRGRAPKGMILVDMGERQVAAAVHWAHLEVDYQGHISWGLEMRYR